MDGIELGNDIRNVEKIRQEFGMVFLQFDLFLHLTVVQNITPAPGWVRRMPKKESQELAMQHLKRVGIPEQADEYPAKIFSDPQNDRTKLFLSQILHH